MLDRAVLIDLTRSTPRDLPTSIDLAQLQYTRKTLSPQELKKLAARVRTLEEMARLEDRLKVLEDCKRLTPYDYI